MKIIPTDLPGVTLLEPRKFEDARGFFAETWHRQKLAEGGIDVDFVQENQSLSRQVGTVRGLHCQLDPHAQAKLVRVVRGAVFDVAVDIRPGSPTYGKWTGALLSAENMHQLFIPEGFLHGFVTREPDTEVFYKCSDFYAPTHERSVRFDDPEIGIDWGIDPKDAILSDKDANAPLLRNLSTREVSK
ncbi:MAG: dTDP-4-dehydrorhamnose 3,5-epimerase [Rhizobiaceae bacterium]|nr:dTDP-4-dehydrorhamnose 3,5-epimerase [Rhizobiaceae bacterium]